MSKIIGNRVILTAGEEAAYLASHGTQAFRFNPETIFAEAFRVISPPENRRPPAVQPDMLGGADKPDKAASRRKPAFLPEHIKRANGSSVTLLKLVIDERQLGLPPKCLNPHIARVYCDLTALAGALVIAEERAAGSGAAA